MARFRATGAVVIGARKYKAGTVFADTVGSALPGDVVMVGLSSGKGLSPNLRPLDAGATAIMAASVFANEVPWVTSGCTSVDG
jgi:hypothetical protein